LRLRVWEARFHTLDTCVVNFPLSEVILPLMRNCFIAGANLRRSPNPEGHGDQLLHDLRSGVRLSKESADFGDNTVNSLIRKLRVLWQAQNLRRSAAGPPDFTYSTQICAWASSIVPKIVKNRPAVCEIEKGQPQNSTCEAFKYAPLGSAHSALGLTTVTLHQQSRQCRSAMKSGHWLPRNEDLQTRVHLLRVRSLLLYRS
jgi:hypothetical protein